MGDLKYDPPIFMLSSESLDKEIENITKLVLEIELAITFEEDPSVKNNLRSAAGQLKAARTWLVKIKKDNQWS